MGREPRAKFSPDGAPLEPRSFSSAAVPGPNYHRIQLPTAISRSEMQSSENPGVRKRTRKPRGRGLRTVTGCLTCRKRHKKCDETLPTCGPCSKSSRECLYPSVGNNSRTGPNDGSEPVQGGSAIEAPGRQDLSCEQGATQTSDGSSGSTHAPISSTGVPGQALHASPQHSHVRLEEPDNGPISNGAREVGGPVGFEDATHIQTVYNTPDTILSEYLTTDLASTRWLDLLATDAAHADKAFSLPPTRYPSPALGDLSFEQNASQPDPQSLNAAVSQAQVQTGLGGNEYSRLNQAIPDNNDLATTYERNAWQLDRNIPLQDHEVDLFRTFAERAALWLDVFDPSKHFSTHATRLAVRLQTHSILRIMCRPLSLTAVSWTNSYGTSA